MNVKNISNINKKSSGGGFSARFFTFKGNK